MRLYFPRVNDVVGAPSVPDSAWTPTLDAVNAISSAIDSLAAASNAASVAPGKESLAQYGYLNL